MLCTASSLSGVLTHWSSCDSFTGALARPPAAYLRYFMNAGITTTCGWTLSTHVSSACDQTVKVTVEPRLLPRWFVVNTVASLKVWRPTVCISPGHTWLQTDRLVKYETSPPTTNHQPPSTTNTQTNPPILTHKQVMRSFNLLTSQIDKKHKWNVTVLLLQWVLCSYLVGK